MPYQLCRVDDKDVIFVLLIELLIILTAILLII